MSALHSLEAEQSILGAAMYAPDNCEDAFDRLKPDLFFDPVNADLWAVMDSIRRKGGIADPVTVMSGLGAHDGLRQLGGMDHLVLLLEKAQVWALASHVDVVCDMAARRAIQRLVGQVSAMAADTSTDSAEAVLGELERGAAEIARDGTSAPTSRPVGLTALAMMEAAYNGEFVGTSVGLDVLDKVTGGIRQDDVWFIGGRTSMGKSVMGLCLARGLAEQGRGVLMFSLEMPEREVQARLAADIAYSTSIPDNGQHGGNVKYGDILKGRGTAMQRERAFAAARKLASLPLSVNDTGGLSIEDIRRQSLRAMRAWAKAGVEPGAILIDHIGLVKPHNKRGGDSKAAETADVVNELKAIAKQVRAPIIALCQVNRNTENRQDKRPTMADLNWSGAIEQIADFVCLLYRDSYYVERETVRDFEKEVRVKHDIELMIHKNRSGPICNIKAFVDIACNAIRDPVTSARAYG